MVDDTERRLNVLFDALNCETLSQDTVAQLHQIIEGSLLSCLAERPWIFADELFAFSSLAIQSGDANYALELHLQLLTSGPSSDNLTAWMVRSLQLGVPFKFALTRLLSTAGGQGHCTNSLSTLQLCLRLKNVTLCPMFRSTMLAISSLRGRKSLPKQQCYRLQAPNQRRRPWIRALDLQSKLQCQSLG